MASSSGSPASGSNGGRRTGRRGGVRRGAGCRGTGRRGRRRRRPGRRGTGRPACRGRRGSRVGPTSRVRRTGRCPDRTSGGPLPRRALPAVFLRLRMMIPEGRRARRRESPPRAGRAPRAGCRRHPDPGGPARVTPASWRFGEAEQQRLADPVGQPPPHVASRPVLFPPLRRCVRTCRPHAKSKSPTRAAAAPDDLACLHPHSGAHSEQVLSGCRFPQVQEHAANAPARCPEWRSPPIAPLSRTGIRKGVERGPDRGRRGRAECHCPEREFGNPPPNPPIRNPLRRISAGPERPARPAAPAAREDPAGLRAGGPQSRRPARRPPAVRASATAQAASSSR